MAKKKVVEEEVAIENISTEALENVMSTRYATYARYVIQDRAIPDVRDGLKPVQRRIIFAMYNTHNTIDHPTKKCAHTVGEVMGKYHPHGDSSIYEALARMSQDWKVRAPLIDFQGNNGSIDGDSPAAYRYTEARLSLLSNELVRDLEKNTVDMQLTFDDSEYEPVVLPSRFPNLFVNGSEGIAVAMATEIPTHNLKEIIEATIYRLNHKTATVEDLMQYVPGPDFPTGGIVYQSEGLKSIYTTGKGRIEIVAKAEIVQQKDMQQIVITQIPYKIVKINIVHEIDIICHNKSIDGILEVRDESDFDGIRIVVDLKKDAPADKILAYLYNKTSMRSSYTANVVAIVNGRPKTLNLLDYIDAYANHQIDVFTRKTKFDLNKAKDRLHIVEGLIIATLNISRVVQIIRQSKDKADSKINLINEFKISEAQAEAIVTMQLYKLSNTDELVLEEEKKSLLADIEKYEGYLNDEKKLIRAICHDLNDIADKFGDERRTLITEKEEVKPIDKRDLIRKEECYIAVSRDGYIKRSTIKSFNSSGENCIPGLKDGDAIIAVCKGMTTDYLLGFTNLGNYITLPIFEIPESKWKDEGGHISNLVELSSGKEKIVRASIVSEYRNDIFFVILTKNGQIKRTAVSEFELVRRSKPVKCMKLLPSDEVVDVQISTGMAKLMVFSAYGQISCFSESEISPLGIKAGGVKAMTGLAKDKCASLLTYQEDEKGKIILITNEGCQRILNSDKVDKGSRLSKNFIAFKSFKSDSHALVRAFKIPYSTESYTLFAFDNAGKSFVFTINDFHMTEIDKMCRKNIEELGANKTIQCIYSYDDVNTIDKKMKSQYIPMATEEDDMLPPDNGEPIVDSKEDDGVEKVSIFDDFFDDN